MSETCAQEVYIITLPVDGIQLQSLILTGTGTGVGTDATLSYSPASSDGVETKTPADDVKPDIIEEVDDQTAGTAGFDAGQKAPCSGLDTLAAVADRLRQEMLDEEAAERGEVDLNAKLDGLYLFNLLQCSHFLLLPFLITVGGAVYRVPVPQLGEGV